MSLSKETVQRMGRELGAPDLSPADLDATMALLTPGLEGLEELDALDLDGVEPAVIFTLPVPVAEAGGAAPGAPAGGWD